VRCNHEVNFSGFFSLAPRRRSVGTYLKFLNIAKGELSAGEKRKR